MDRLIYKEADGDLTCRSRDFDKVFPTLYAYEETGLTPEQIVAMKGQHMARQALIDEVERLKAELKDERHRHDRYVDFELAESEELRKVKAERDCLLANFNRPCLCCENFATPYQSEPCVSCVFGHGEKMNWEMAVAEDINVPGKQEG